MLISLGPAVVELPFLYILSFQGRRAPHKTKSVTMNLNIINKDCTEWDKDTWNDAYRQYCLTNMFGPKTKREYFDMVTANHKRLKEQSEPLSDELSTSWLRGFKNARLWAKKHGCNRDGVLDVDVTPAINIKELADDVREIQWKLAQR